MRRRESDAGRCVVGSSPSVMGTPILAFRSAVVQSRNRRATIASLRGPYRILWSRAPKRTNLPALEAAHIRDYHEHPEHSISNGILFRADIHKLFDTGYVTVTPDHRFEVSTRIKEEFENGRDYYRLHGAELRLPANPAHRPLAEALAWHNEQRYLG